MLAVIVVMITIHILHMSIIKLILFSYDPHDPCVQPDARVLAMGGGQTADFQGDEVRHGEHVPGGHHHHRDDHDDVELRKHIRVMNDC